MTKLRFHTREYRRFSRRWWFSGARSAFWIAIVTALIWVYADMEVTEPADLRATITLTAGNNPNLVILSTKRVEVAFKVRGNHSSLAAYNRELKKAGSLIVYDVSDRSPGRRHIIRIADILKDEGGLAKAGLTIESASPEILSLDLDRRILVGDIPVEFVYTGATLVGPAAVRPAKVPVRVAETRWKEIATQLAGKKPSLKTVAVDLKNHEKDKPIKVPAEIISSIADVPVEPETTSVTVTLQISELTDTKTITVGVRVDCPPDWMEDDTWTQYTLVRKDPLDWRKKITLAGPKKDLDRLGLNGVDAYVTLLDSDKKPLASWLSREVKLRFPKDFQLKLIGDKPTVNFKLVQRPAPSPP